MIQGYDYASIDGNHVDFTKVQGSFVIVRGAFTYKGISQPDPHMPRDREPAQHAGFRFGSYMILGWDANGPTPEDQARTFCKAFGNRREGELPPWLDLEADSARAVGRTPQECLDWAHRAYDVLQRAYRVVGVYTSARVWSDVFGGMGSRMGDGPLWCKIPYPYNAGNLPHPESYMMPSQLPGPWNTPSSPGLWITQYQGDAKPVPGFSSTVDLNVWNTGVLSGETYLTSWLKMQLGRANCASVSQFQRLHGLKQDSVIGPSTFAALAR